MTLHGTNGEFKRVIEYKMFDYLGEYECPQCEETDCLYYEECPACDTNFVRCGKCPYKSSMEDCKAVKDAD